MKLLINKLLLGTAFIASLLFISCGDDDNPGPSGEYASGIFIVNEGNFGDGDGSISFYNRETEEVEQTIFQTVNGVDTLGDVIQSAYAYDGLMYLIANNSNKVEVVNSATFERQFSMTNVTLPRYMTVAEGKGYLTEWVSFTEAGQVSIFDLRTGSIEKRITVGSLPEDIEVVRGKIFVTEAFSSDMLYIIDMNDENSITTLTPGPGTNQLVLDKDDNLWVACGGSTSGDFPNTTPNNDGKLVKINTSSNEIAKTIEVGANYSAKIAINNDDDRIFLYITNSVYSVDPSSFTFDSSPFFTVSESFGFYGIGVDPKTNHVLVTDAKDFLEDGEVYVYNSTGSSVNSFRVGRIPNGFVFN